MDPFHFDVSAANSKYNYGDTADYELPSSFLNLTPDWSPFTSAHIESANEVAEKASDLSTPPPQLPCWADIDTGDLPVSFCDTERCVPKYDFRLGPRDPDKRAQLTWVDQDATATYDPSAKNDPWLCPPTERIPRQKRPRPERLFNYAEYKVKRPRTITWQRGRIEGKRLVIILKFTSQQSIDVLGTYGSSLDNWPGAAFTDEDGQPDWEAWWNSHEPVPESAFQFSDTYDLRDRTAFCQSFRHSAEAGELSLEEITLGHPAARGCKACFELGHPCPLLEEGSKYPCTLCVEDAIECELIMEPLEKSRCTCCVKRRIVCPFASDGTQRGPCQPCSLASLKCIAGPKSGRTRTGPCLDAPYETDEYVDHGRAFVTCTQCRSVSKWCPLKGKREIPPCKRCDENGLDCTFEPLNTRTINSRRRLKSKSNSVLNNPLSSFIKPLNTNPQVLTETIITKLAHPIRFNYQPQENTSTACHWCDDLVYGLLGLGEIEAEVVYCKDGQGYIEISGGHTAAGYSPSRMCDMCTLERIIIAACRIHELEPIDGMDPDKFCFDTVTDWMMPGQAASAPFQWCSVCPTPAFFRCCKKTDVDMMQGSGDGGIGCGLTLCEYCAVTLVGEHDGSLEALINKMRVDRAEDAFRLRADVDFLHPEGELLRRMAAS